MAREKLRNYPDLEAAVEGAVAKLNNDGIKITKEEFEKKIEVSVRDDGFKLVTFKYVFFDHKDKELSDKCKAYFEKERDLVLKQAMRNVLKACAEIEEIQRHMSGETAPQQSAVVIDV
ncbi:MAG: hypothetical protein KGH52_00685 [Candidatus Micrarchaeota archaeon]|nr:hypothetical protein [Candidatus Micrarchaeota archaeon]